MVEKNLGEGGALEKDIEKSLGVGPSGHSPQHPRKVRVTKPILRRSSSENVTVIKCYSGGASGGRENQAICMPEDEAGLCIYGGILGNQRPRRPASTRNT